LRILIHDFAGHPFEAQLSRELASRGNVVVHAYCGKVATGRGALSSNDGDPSSLSFVDAATNGFERYKPLRRVETELRYGKRLARLVADIRPEMVVSANTPLLAQALLWRAARGIGARRVYWLQDFLGRGTRAVLTGRSTFLGFSFGRALESLETRLLRESDQVIVITDDFLDELGRRSVFTPATVVENWAPLDELPPRDKANDWSREHGLAVRPVALYSGTLGLKHDPEHLLRAAEAVSEVGALVVISEGAGRALLEAERSKRGLENLILLDYVNYERLPDVLGTADVCLVLLEREAGTFSVPSKTLSYLAAGRAVIGAIPAENLAAETILRAGAGAVLEPGDYGAFATAVRNHLCDPQRTAAMGAAGRAYAEEAFDIRVICDRILAGIGIHQ
jgi:putative colanic acid biosynthesis glycosyltransferase WcaI